MRSRWPLARLRPTGGLKTAPLAVCPDPEIVAAAESELRALPGQIMKDGRRCAIGATTVGPAGWFEGVGAFVLDAALRRVIAAAPQGESAEWEHLVVAWALPSLVGEIGATVLHGCVVAGRDRAWIICAPTGGGKTTTSLALLDAGMRLLSDDTAVVDPGTATVAAGPRGSRVLADDGTKTVRFRDAPLPAGRLPLAGLGVLLPRGARRLQRRLAPAEAYIALVPHVCPVSDAARRRMLSHLADLARSRPVLAISMPDGLDALPAAAAELAELLG